MVAAHIYCDAYHQGVKAMPTRIVVVKARRDPEAGVWFVESSDLPGLNVEAETLEALEQQLSLAVVDLLEAGDSGDGERAQYDVPIELIAHSSSRVRIPA
jgi:predicted RNase H-like HicB family nuclease